MAVLSSLKDRKTLNSNKVIDQDALISIGMYGKAYLTLF